MKRETLSSLFLRLFLLAFLFFSLFFFLAVRSELSSISPFDCSFLPRAFLLPPLLSRPIARPRNLRDRWSGNRSFSSKILLSHLSIIVSHCVHAITIKYIFLLFSIYSSISNPRSETIYCHLIGKIRSFKETIGSSRIYIYIYIRWKKWKKAIRAGFPVFKGRKTVDVDGADFLPISTF